jgi:hypothetical protein
MQPPDSLGCGAARAVGEQDQQAVSLHLVRKVRKSSRSASFVEPGDRRLSAFLDRIVDGVKAVGDGVCSRTHDRPAVVASDISLPALHHPAVWVGDLAPRGSVVAVGTRPVARSPTPSPGRRPRGSGRSGSAALYYESPGVGASIRPTKPGISRPTPNTARNRAHPQIGTAYAKSRCPERPTRRHRQPSDRWRDALSAPGRPHPAAHRAGPLPSPAERRRHHTEAAYRARRFRLRQRRQLPPRRTAETAATRTADQGPEPAQDQRPRRPGAMSPSCPPPPRQQADATSPWPSRLQDARPNGGTGSGQLKTC